MAFSRRFALGALGLLLWGCGGGDGGGGDCDPIAATLVSRIEVTPPTASVADGESVQLTARAFSCDGSQLMAPTFTWQSADATTVSVSTSGMAVGVKLGGPVSISAAAQGKTGTAQVAVVARAVAMVRVEPATANLAVGRTSTLVAKAFDAEGNELPGRTAAWASDNEAVVTVAETGAITGIAAGGPVTVTATIEGHSGSAQVTVVDAAVATVTVTPAATDVPAGSTVQLTAVLKDDAGNVLTGRAVLWTTTDAVRTAVSSTGAVTGLQLGGPVTILATSEGRSGSSQVTVVPGAASRLAFVVQPRNVVAGAAISPDVTVEVRDPAGNRVPTSTASVTISLEANPGSGTLSGIRTVSAVAGVATFPGLGINRVGSGYTLSAAASGLASATSSGFNVTPGAAVTMRFSVQPSDAAAGSVIAPPIQVELVDGQGNRATGSTMQVTLALGSNPGGAVLTGTSAVNAIAGVATFSALSLNAVGVGYTLVASAAVPSVTSTAFAVTPGAPASLTFLTQPTNVVAGNAIAPAVQVEVRDAQGNLVTSPETPVTMSPGDSPGGGTLGGTLTVNSAGGVATFDGLTLNIAASGYTLVASGAGLAATSAAFDVLPGPATRIGFAVQPTNIRESAAFAPEVAVEVRDALGNRATTFVGNVSLQLRNAAGNGGAGGGNQLLGGSSRPFVQGLAVFSGMTVNFTGLVLSPRSFTMRTQGSIAMETSSVFTVTP